MAEIPLGKKPVAHRMILPPDSSAFALTNKNFGILPASLNARWTNDFFNPGYSDQPLPERLIIELLNSCNLDCPMCRVGRYGVHLERSLPFDIFSDLVTGLSNDLTEIRLNGLGESTLLSDFSRYVDTVLNNGIRLELITNGSGNLRDYETILNNNGIIMVSWDAASPELFEQLRRPARWDAYSRRLQELATTATATGVADRLFLLFTLQVTNIPELPEVVRFCKDLQIRNIVVNVMKRENQDWCAHNRDAILRSMKEADDLARRNDLGLFLPDQIGGIPLTDIHTLESASCNCMMPFSEAVVRWNGDVQVCNMFNPYIYGNIHLDSFKNIWNNRFAKTFRMNVNTDSRHPYCKNCTYMRDVYHARTL